MEGLLQSQLCLDEVVYAGQGVVQLCHVIAAALAVAKSASLRFRLPAKTAPAPLLLLSQGDPLRWARLGFPGSAMGGLQPQLRPHEIVYAGQGVVQL